MTNQSVDRSRAMGPRINVLSEPIECDFGILLRFECGDADERDDCED